DADAPTRTIAPVPAVPPRRQRPEERKDQNNKENRCNHQRASLSKPLSARPPEAGCPQGPSESSDALAGRLEVAAAHAPHATAMRHGRHGPLLVRDLRDQRL